MIEGFAKKRQSNFRSFDSSKNMASQKLDVVKEFDGIKN